jgi:hypothetical protein
MDLKDVIGQLGIMRGNCCYEGSREQQALTAAAEALALVAWAEEVKPDLAFVDGYWIVLVDDKNGRAKRIAKQPTFLGAIREAKEAYEAE